jgi:hypothetical protein
MTADLRSRIPARLASITGLCLMAAASTAAAQTRWVIVNGERLNDAKVERLARIQCAEIPDGAYWINERSGAWGYAGNPQVQGHLGDLCRAAPGGVNRDGTYGPFVTMGRANQEANAWRARGFSANAFHNGDGYYVRVWR